MYISLVLLFFFDMNKIYKLCFWEKEHLDDFLEKSVKDLEGIDAFFS